MLLASDLSQLAINLNQEASCKDRFRRMLSLLRDLLECDASALMIFKDQQFIPLAMCGLAEDVVGRHFCIAEHPRLKAIALADDIVRFPANSTLPDPFDGLIPNDTGKLYIHGCIGFPLRINQQLIGALTIDSFNADAFSRFTDNTLRTISSITAAALYNALLIERLESKLANGDAENVFENMITSDTEIIGESQQIRALKSEIMAVSACELNVLILGETGVGKELVAKAIHGSSTRKDKPLIYLNCAALPESVAESELFGHIKGAFTGAINNRQGKFELADTGTLFLDEIGELPLNLQAKLLRVIQYGDLQRVGDDKNLKVDVRIIAATNKDLLTEVNENRFRADLYHRLSVFPIMVPPLRERGDDVILLAGYFIEKIRIKLGISHIKLSSTSLKSIMHNDWLGNVRELENAIYRAAIMAKSEASSNIVTIEIKHFNKMLPCHKELDSTMDSVMAAWSGEPLREATDNFQKNILHEVLQINKNNWSATARDLGMNSGNLHRLAKRLNIK